MSEKTIKLEIATPERVVLTEAIAQITVPTRDGEITILPGHIPLVASLRAGVIHIKKENDEPEIISTSGGFIEVLMDKIVILADTAEMAAEIDLARAEEAHRRAEEMKTNLRHQDDVDFAEVNAAIERELARTHAVKRWRNIKSISGNREDKSE